MFLKNFLSKKRNFHNLGVKKRNFRIVLKDLCEN